MNPLKTIVSAAAVVASVGTIGGGAWALDSRYATKGEVAGNSQSILLIQINNARASGDNRLLRRLCDDFRRVHGWLPGSCS